jgi:STE24 endopeptidase
METTLSAGQEVFAQEQVERSRRYHRPVYAIRLLGIAVGLLTLGLLSFSALGDAVYSPVADWPWWAAALVFGALVVLVTWLVQTPLAYWRGYVHEHRWGFSSQTRSAWFVDRLKGLGVSVVLTSVPIFLLIATVHVFPGWWPIVAATGAALLVLVLGFVAPLLLEPVFNRFDPLPDEDLAAELRALADRAGVPVRDVLVADASRRTTKHNAYVSGLGRTRRVVIWDTLLARGEPGEIRLVVAHELGHRRFRHVARWTAISMALVAAFVLILWALLQWGALLDAMGASGPGDPRVIPFVLFLGSVLELAVQPFANAISRRWERACDRFSLDLTRDPAAYERTHHLLALENLGDLDPPKAIYLLFASHPTAPERLAAGRAWTG